MNKILLQLRHEPPPTPASTVIDTVKSRMDVFFRNAATASASLSREDMKALGRYAASKCEELYAGNPDVEIKFKVLVSEFGGSILPEIKPSTERTGTVDPRNCFKFGDTEVKIVSDDIVEMEVDAIVNAANPQLTADTGVCGAIHRAAGKDLLAAECRKIPVKEGVRCPTGSAAVTGPGNLAGNGVKGIIHAVGPRVAGANPTEGEEVNLYLAYLGGLVIAAHKGWKSIAFPIISYSYPPEKQAKIVCGAINTWHGLNAKGNVKEIYLNIPPTEAFIVEMYRAQLSALSRH